MISKSRLAQARALAASVREHEPTAEMTVLVSDEVDGYFDASAEPFRVLTLAELQAHGAVPAGASLLEMAARYDPMELACALKPWLLRWQLERDTHAVCLDSDMQVYAPLAPLVDRLGDHSVALTPHLRSPLPPDGEQPDHLAIALAGAHNAGFLAVRAGRETEDALRWLCDRLWTECRDDPPRGLVWDQRWLDLLPGLFASVTLLHDPAWNAAYWTAATSRFELVEGQLTVDGAPVRCFHFSGYDPDWPERLSRFDGRIRLAQQPALRAICDRYGEVLEAHGRRECESWPYGWATLPSGVELTPLLRGLWDRARQEGAVDEAPFSPCGEAAFAEWLRAEQPGIDGRGLSRYLVALHAARVDLRERLPDPQRADRDAFLDWAGEQARRHPGGDVARFAGLPAPAARRPGLRDLPPGESLQAERGEVVVCIPLFGAPAEFSECLHSVLAHTPADVRVLIADDASPDPALRALVGEMVGPDTNREVAYLRQPANLGFPENVNAAFAAAAPADVIVLNSDCVVSEGWVEGLRRAAYSDGPIATASAMTNHGTILSLPERNRPVPAIPQTQTAQEVARAVARLSLRLYPRLPTAIGHCMYVRRQALDLVGDFDATFSPGYGEEVDFSQRCLLHGLSHVAADDVFVLHHAGASLSEDGSVNPVQRRHEQILNARYPYYERMQTAAAASDAGRLARAVAIDSLGLAGMEVTIDGRCLGPVTTGTQVHVLELVVVLSRIGEVGLRVIVPRDIGEHPAGVLAGLSGVRSIFADELHPGMPKSAVAHRPFQVSSEEDLEVLRWAADRCVLTHHDLIAYRNPGYFPGYPQWEGYRSVTRRAMALADLVVFVSHHAAQDALSEDLIDPARVRVVHNGVDHTRASMTAAEAPPPRAEGLDERPFLLCLGTDFRHKNRVFAISLLAALRAEHGFSGCLVLAGPRVSHGSSSGEEAAMLAAAPQLAEHVVRLPAVSEAEKEWLLQHAEAFVYPTTIEGFGLPPFEAADHGLPSLFAAHTALAETLPSGLATLVPWDARASASRVAALLADADARARHVAAIRAAGRRFNWRATGTHLNHVYREATVLPAREARAIATEATALEHERRELQRRYDELWPAYSDHARRLMGPEGLLDIDTQRSLRAVAERRAARALVFRPLRFLYRVGRRLGGRRPPRQADADRDA